MQALPPQKLFSTARSSPPLHRQYCRNKNEYKTEDRMLQEPIKNQCVDKPRLKQKKERRMSTGTKDHGQQRRVETKATAEGHVEEEVD